MIRSGTLATRWLLLHQVGEEEHHTRISLNGEIKSCLVGIQLTGTETEEHKKQIDHIT